MIDISEGSAGHAVIAREVERALDRDPGFVVQDTHALLNAGGERDDAANVKSAQAFRTAGLAALEAGELEDAVEQLQTAAALMAKSFAFLREADEYRQLLVESGVAQLRAGEEEAASRTLERAVVFGAESASIPLKPAEEALLAAARQKIKEAPRGGIEIASQPASAEAWVDGRFVGVTPCAAWGLPAGEHIVTMYKAGYAPVTATAVANTEAPAQVQAKLQPARRKLLYDEMLEKLRPEMDHLGGTPPMGGEGVKQAGSLLLSEVVLVVRSRGPVNATEVELFLFDTQSQRLLQRVSGTVDTGSSGLRAAIAPLVARVSEIDWAVALGGEAEDPTARRESTRLVKKWWFWTIIGGVVAGGATAAVLLATKGDGESAPATTGSVVLSF
ncbi:MAG: PEGA domain-containing protein [Deltaproteobacteria bacterium]|nr:PEGA domain-containing protein [Deltaproteobacteria bacterium]MCB9786999.1 PEGA domain-containing protein [Deltaproteobacteria bacterium]